MFNIHMLTPVPPTKSSPDKTSLGVKKSEVL